MKQKIEHIQNEINSFEILNAETLEQFRLQFLSKKGSITELFEEFKNVLPFKRALEKGLIELKKFMIKQ